MEKISFISFILLNRPREERFRVIIHIVMKEETKLEELIIMISEK